MNRYDVPEHQADEIRARRRDNATYRDIQEACGLPVSVIRRVCADVVPRRLDPELRRELHDEIRRLRAEGLTYELIAAQCGVDPNFVVRASRDVETPNQRRRREMASVPA